VQRAFATIWGDDQLLASFDGANIFRPWHRSKQAEILEKTGGSWFHVDQGTTKPGLNCVQGLVSYMDATPATGGLCVIDGSHKKFADFLKYAATSEKDFVLVPRGDPLLNQGFKLVTCRAGDLLLWDSRCIHCNTAALVRPTSPSTELLRFVTYVCMTPRRKATAEVLRLRCLAATQGVTTSHWPHEFHPVKKDFAPPGAGLDPLAAPVKAALMAMPKQKRNLIGFGDDL